MYKQNTLTKTSIHINEGIEGETIETKVERIVNNKEPIKDGAPLLYTERKKGVLPGTNIRTDRFDVAIDAMDKVTADKITKRENRLKAVKNENKSIDKVEPIQGTDTQNSK